MAYQDKITITARRTAMLGPNAERSGRAHRDRTSMQCRPGAPFAPDALEWLAVLKNDDRAAVEALRAQLKGAGCQVTALDEAISEEWDLGSRHCGASRQRRTTSNVSLCPRAHS